jgi:hypothetical protein
MERALMMWERKLLREICGPTCEIGSWTIKMTQEIYNEFKSPDIVTIIKVCKFEWLGHVVRMDSDRTVRSYWKANQKEGEKKEDLD